MKSIKSLKNTKDKTFLLRAGFDVPMKNEKVIDAKRIKAIIPTIKYLASKGPLVIMSHQGRPNGKIDMSLSLKPLVPVLQKLLGKKVLFAKSCIGVETEKMTHSLKKGQILLLENLRFEKGEEENDPTFAKELAKLGDIYVCDAFSDMHREHASIVGVPKFLPSYAGFQLFDEIKNLGAVLNTKKHPFLVILGGAKFETKMPVIKRFLPVADHVFIGGALLNDILEVKGYEVGRSLIDKKNSSFLGGQVGREKILKNKKLILPSDVIVRKGNLAKLAIAEFARCEIAEIGKEDMIIDIGPDSIKKLESLIKNAKLILWNGPMGKYETEPDKYDATKMILKMIAKSKAFSVIGGGDTVDLISEMKMEKKFSFVSTGGGAMLEFLVKGTLPGIKALEHHKGNK